MTTDQTPPQARIEALVQRRGKLLNEVKQIEDELLGIKTELKAAIDKIPYLDDDR